MGGIHRKTDSVSDSEEETDDEDEYEWRSPGCPPILVILLLLCFFGWGLALGPYLRPPSPSPPSETPLENSIYRSSDTWAGALQRRDAALEEVMKNWWTQTLSPELITVAAQQRRLPYVVAGSTAVAIACLGGFPTAAAIISLGGLVITGRSMPDLWSVSTISAASGAMPMAASHPMVTGSPPIAHLMGI